MECQTTQQEPVVLYNPESFDPHLYLPADLHKYADEVRWLVHVLYQRRVLDRRQPDAHVPLKAQYLRRVLPFRSYTTILDALAATGVLEIDKRYVRGEKSRGYRLRADLMHETHRRYTPGPAVASKVLNLKSDLAQSVTLDVHKHLLDNLKRVEIDQDVSDPRPEVRLQVQYIRDRQWFFTVCPYGRVHTNLTSLASSARPCLTVDGHRLVNLDIRNSQPLVLSVVLLNYFMNGESLTSVHGFNLDTFREETLLYQIWSKTTDTKSLPNPTPLRCAVTSVRVSPLIASLDIPEDVKMYIALTETGQLYEHLMTQWEIPHAERRQFKQDFFNYVLYCRDHTRYTEGRRFEETFPNVMRAVKDLKRRDYTQAATLMQRVESSLMVNRVTRRVMERFPDAFVATIHDSILTTPDHADDVQAIIMHEFARVGITPTIKVERYDEQADRQMAG